MAATTNETTADETRARVHAMWASVAMHWGARADEVEARAAAVTPALLAQARLAPGDRVLELACGPGGAGLAAAPLVAPGGHVVLTDVAEEMTTIAASRAREQGITNVEATTVDVEHIDLPSHSFDAVLCREGLMFAVEPQTAVGEIARVLRPGGRASIAVWGPQDVNPWLGIVFEAVTEATGFPVPPPGIPGPFALGDEARLRALFIDAGFVDVTVERIEEPARADSFDAWWARTRDLAGPLAKIFESLPPEQVDGIVDRVRDRAAPYVSSEGISLPGVTLLLSASMPTA